MITQREIKYYASLLHKKYRQQERKFIVEGGKLISEGIESGYHPEIILTTSAFSEEQSDYFDSVKEYRIEKIKTAELQRLTDTKSPQQITAVFPFFNVPESWPGKINAGRLVFLDNVSDPGNAGTIIRNCDWFGITDVLLSEGTVELYNPKLIRATMGSLFHLNLYEDVKLQTLEILKEKGYKIICSDIKGESVIDFKFPPRSIIVFSNEAHGPGSTVREAADHIISINKKGKAESLNVASASAVILTLLTK
jgi:TrmH family RNA methyltransferase